MTIADLREITRRRVVPENLVPQNVIGLLIDDEEDTAPPKLDAFTFLTRLRALGIGSADFLYLLEGCEAPQSAIDRVKANPAMNLQGLILTLESSGLTSDDYLRILYTARQIWERTLTLRLEKSEMALQETSDEKEEDYSEPSFEEVMDELERQNGAEENSDGVSDYEEFKTAFVTEELAPPILTATEDIPKETVEDIVNEPIEEPIEEIAVENVEDTVSEETVEEKAEESVEEIAEEPVSEDIFEGTTVYTEEIEPIKQPYNGETTMIIQIDQEMLKQNLELLAKAEEDAVRSEAARLAAEQAQQEARAAFAKAEEAEASGKCPEEEPGENHDSEPESPVKTGKQAPFVVTIPEEKRTYHKGAIITAAVGAAVVVGASVAVDVFAGFHASGTVKFAELSNDIFDEIYDAYYNKTPGAEYAAAYAPDYQTLFGDMLVKSDGFGTFSYGEHIYNITEEAVCVNVFKNGTLTPSEELLPPKDTSFTAVFDDMGTLVAVFGGERECGYMRISGGSVLYTVRQDGFLTDFALDENGVMLGSVYTPKFSRNFKAEDIEEYLPSAGIEKTVIAPENVILSRTEGYSYAVSARYSLISGETEHVRAALGDPVAASADGRFAMRGTKEYLLIAIQKPENESGTAKDKILSAAAELDSHIAFFENGIAVGKNTTVSLYSNELKMMSQIANIPQSYLSQGTNSAAMRFDGNTLLIFGENGLCRAADCADPELPNIIELKEVNGTANSENALIPNVGANGAELSYYVLENGIAKEKYKYTKPLTAEELSTLVFGGIDTVVLDGERCGAAFSYFDGVSVISDYAIMSPGRLETELKELFDDKTGFTLAFKSGSVIYAEYGGGVSVVP